MKDYSMIVSVDEFKANIDHYMSLADGEKITLTRNGRPIALIEIFPKSKRAILDSLCGTLPSTATLEEAREERLAKYAKDWDDCHDIQ